MIRASKKIASESIAIAGDSVLDTNALSFSTFSRRRRLSILALNSLSKRNADDPLHFSRGSYERYRDVLDALAAAFP